MPDDPEHHILDKAEVWCVGVLMYTAFCGETSLGGVGNDSIVDAVTRNIKSHLKGRCASIYVSHIMSVHMYIIRKCLQSMCMHMSTHTDCHDNILGDIVEVVGSALAPEPDARPSMPELMANSFFHPCARCVICIAKPATMAILPCGHRCICPDHAPKMLGGRCPICRSPVTTVHQIFDT